LDKKTWLAIVKINYRNSKASEVERHNIGFDSVGDAVLPIAEAVKNCQPRKEFKTVNVCFIFEHTLPQ
jgi:hypothetical protein